MIYRSIVRVLRIATGAGAMPYVTFIVKQNDGKVNTQQASKYIDKTGPPACLLNYTHLKAMAMQVTQFTIRHTV